MRFLLKNLIDLIATNRAIMNRMISGLNTIKRQMIVIINSLSLNNRSNPSAKKSSPTLSYSCMVYVSSR